VHTLRGVSLTIDQGELAAMTACTGHGTATGLLSTATRTPRVKTSTSMTISRCVARLPRLSALYLPDCSAWAELVVPYLPADTKPATGSTAYSAFGAINEGSLSAVCSLSAMTKYPAS
jgi:hypothetical protein